MLQAVHYGQNADALLELFQLSDNRMRGQVLLVAQAQRFANRMPSPWDAVRESTKKTSSKSQLSAAAARTDRCRTG